MPKLGGLQFIRAFAAIMVLIGHAIAEAEYYFDLSMNLDFIPWTRGVDVFFVVSGFIITLSAARYTGRPLAFLQRRLVRVVPLYYFFTTLMVISVVFFPNETKETIFDLGQVFSSYGFFPYARPDGRVAPILSLGWTLNFEMFFYVLCAVGIWIGRTPWSLSLIIMSFVSIGVMLQFNTTPWAFWTDPIMIEFIFGIALGKAYQAGKTRPHLVLSVTIFLSAIGLLIYFDTTALPRFIAAGVPAALIVAAGTLFYPSKFQHWQIIGDASYALYLSHRFPLRLTTILLVPILPTSTMGSWIYVLCASGTSIIIAILVHLWLERPLLTSKEKLVYG